MDTTEVLFSATVALIYPVFMNKFAEKVSETTSADKEKTIFNKHVLLILTGALGIFSATVVKTHSTKLGLGLGGLLTLAGALMAYWANYNDNMRLAILGVILVVTLYLSTSLKNIHDLNDLFAFQY